jgi:hypothetical protein
MRSFPDRISSSTTMRLSAGGSVMVHYVWGLYGSFSNQWFEKRFDAESSNRQALSGGLFVVDASELTAVTSLLKPAVLVHHEDPPFALVVAT